MTLTFKAVKYTNYNSENVIRDDTLDVTQKEDGSFEVPSSKVLVKIKTAALNPIDLVLRGSTSPLLFHGYKGLGFDYSGVVVGIGKAAAADTGLRVGSRVCGFFKDPFSYGTLAEYALMDAFKTSGKSIRELPDLLSFQQGAAYPIVLGTAVTLLDTIHKENAKRRFLILGGGTTVGKLSVQLAKHVYGAASVTVTCSPKSVDLAKLFGADSWIDYTAHKSILSPVLESVKEHGKFDVILDCCGNKDLFGHMSDILVGSADHGTYETIAGDFRYFTDATLWQLVSNNVGAMMRAVRSSLGLLGYSYKYIELNVFDLWPTKAGALLAQDKVKLTIDSEYEFADFQAAIDRLESGRANGKVLVNISQ